MKLTLIAVIAALCAGAVAANAILPVEVDFEYVPEDFASDEGLDAEAFFFIPNIFSPIYWVIRGALRTLKGVNCSIKGVLDIQTAALTFISNVNSCGGVVSQQVQNVIDACNTVITTTKSIVTLNDTACKNGDYNDETDGSKKTPFFKCFYKMLGNMLKLNQQVRKVVSLIKKVPDAGTGTGVCVKNALNELSLTFTQFPAMVKTCSKLTN